MPHQEIKPIGVTRGFYILLVLITVAFLLLLAEFWLAITWAMILAILIQRPFEELNNRIGHHRCTASALSVLIALLAIVLPATLLTVATAAQLGEVIKNAQVAQGDAQSASTMLEDLIPPTQRLLEALGLDFKKLSEFLTTKALLLGRGTIEFLALLVLSMYLLYFLLRDGPKILNVVATLMPLESHQTSRLAKNIAKTVRATFKGIILMGLIQGAIGGVTFALLGIEHALLWGVLTGVASIIPVIGTSIVWLPISIWLLASGALLKGIILLLVGAVVIGIIDNLLRPIVVGRDARIPDYIVLVTTFGGLVSFGISGFILGPLIAGVFIVCWQMYGELSGESETAGQVR